MHTATTRVGLRRAAGAFNHCDVEQRQHRSPLVIRTRAVVNRSSSSLSAGDNPRHPWRRMVGGCLLEPPPRQSSKQNCVQLNTPNRTKPADLPAEAVVVRAVGKKITVGAPIVRLTATI